MRALIDGLVQAALRRRHPHWSLYWADRNGRWMRSWYLTSTIREAAHNTGVGHLIYRNQAAGVRAPQQGRDGHIH